MKTKLFLFAALFITISTFSQTKKSERKGYSYYKNTSDLNKSKAMNKGELIDAMAKDANLRKRPGRTKYSKNSKIDTTGTGNSAGNRATDYNSSRSNKADGKKAININNVKGKKKSNKTNRDDYNSSRSNKKG